MCVCGMCWCQRLVNHRGAMDRHPPRLVSSPQALASPSRRLRRLTTTGLWLVLGFERSEDVAGTAPRAHQLGIIAEPIPHQPVEHTHLLGDLGGHGLEIGARTDMLAPACPRRFDGLLELAQRAGEIA